MGFGILFFFRLRKKWQWLPDKLTTTFSSTRLSRNTAAFFHSCKEMLGGRQALQASVPIWSAPCCYTKSQSSNVWTFFSLSFFSSPMYSVMSVGLKKIFFSATANGEVMPTPSAVLCCLLFKIRTESDVVPKCTETLNNNAILQHLRLFRFEMRALKQMHVKSVSQVWQVHHERDTNIWRAMQLCCAKSLWIN